MEMAILLAIAYIVAFIERYWVVGVVLGVVAFGGFLLGRLWK